MTTVTRRIVRTTSSDSASSNVDTNKSDDRDKAVGRDMDDDKETRLTLMEEVLLLGLKDQEVC